MFRRSQPETDWLPVAVSGGPVDVELFSFDQVVVERGGRRVLATGHEAILHVGVTGIVGPSGSGKSTLLRLCNRLEAPTSGTVRYLGTDLAAVDPRALRRRVAMVFQQPVALEGTVADDLRQADRSLDGPGVAAALDRVGLPGDLGDRPADDLSGGERQRLGLARSLLTEPDVVLLDEVTSSLDPTNAARIESLVGRLVDDGLHAVWVTHDLDQLRRVADRVLVVIDGAVAAHGPVDAVLASTDPAVRAFLDGAAT